MEKTKLKFADFPWHSEFEYYTEIYYDIWEIIDKAQLNEYSNELEKCQVLLRAYSLNLIFEEGILRSKGEYFEDLYYDIFHHTLENNPTVNLFNLMKLTKNEFNFEDFDDEIELKVELCKVFYKENIKKLLGIVIKKFPKKSNFHIPLSVLMRYESGSYSISEDEDY